MSEGKRFITTLGIIITGWILLLFVGLAVVGANLYKWTDSTRPSSIMGRNRVGLPVRHVHFAGQGIHGIRK